MSDGLVCFFFSLFINKLNSLYFPCIKSCGGHSWSLGPLHRSSGVGLYQMVSEFPIGRLGEHGFFPEVSSEIAVGLRDDIEHGLEVVVQTGSAAPDCGVAVDTGHQQQLLGPRG